MPTYLTPGVYAEEVSTGPRPIAAVGTSTAAFLGVAPNNGAHLNQAYACNNWGQFCKEFVADDSPSTHLACAVFGFFNNGGRRAYIVNVGKGNPVAGDPRRGTGVECLARIDEVAMVAAPGSTDAASYEALLSHCERMGDRIAILDGPDDCDTDALKQIATAKLPASGGGEKEEKPAKGTKTAPPAGLRARTSDGGYGAFYFPWMIGRDPLQVGVMAKIPPSGAIAGIYARTDAMRGVHKAPANELVRGCLGLTYRVGREEQGDLNKHGVNVIRYFPDGIRVWGARTLAPEASEHRYVPVRRTLLMIRESLEEGLRWLVFETSTHTTWLSAVRDIRAFLMLLWRDGVLMGKTPEEAFFVKCDEETNPPEVRDAGQLIAEIGVALIKPAEFVVLRIGQWSSDAEATTSEAAGG